VVGWLEEGADGVALCLDNVSEFFLDSGPNFFSDSEPRRKTFHCFFRWISCITTKTLRFSKSVARARECFEKPNWPSYFSVQPLQLATWKDQQFAGSFFLENVSNPAVQVLVSRSISTSR
jgi:hypothetical protein